MMARKPLFHPGTPIYGGKYKIFRRLGSGTYGEVYEAEVVHEDRYVAIKVSNAERYNENALRELETLRKLQGNPTGMIVVLYDNFEVVVGGEARVCIAIEKLNYSLAVFLKKRKETPFSLSEVSVIGAQLMTVLEYFRGINLLHLDLKPSNILLNDSISAIKIADFGSAYFTDEKTESLAQTLAYRAPEVTLALHPYSFAVDMWSVGCILAEVYTKHSVVKVKSSPVLMDMLEELVRVFGTPPEYMISRSPKTGEISCAALMAIAESSENKRVVSVLRETHDLRGHKDPSYALFPAFLDLLQRIFTYDPDLRITPNDALRHEFFQVTSKLRTAEYDTDTKVGIEQSTPWPEHLFPTSRLLLNDLPPYRKARRDSSLVREHARRRTAEATPPLPSSGGLSRHETSSGCSGRSSESEDSKKE